MKRSALILSAITLVSCAQHHCRRGPENSSPPTAAIPPGADEASKTMDTQRRVRIYKYDGSLQCGQGKPLAVDVMAKELKGIEIFSSQKRPDGLMHIQVCGSPTGIANIYEISEADLAKAEKLGFKKWTFE